MIGGRVDDRDDRQFEFASKFEIALVVGRDGHDRPGAVSGQDVIADPDGDASAAGGVDRVAAGEHAGLLFVGVGPGPLAVGFKGGGVDVFPAGVVLRCVGQPRGDHRVFRRDDHVGGAEKRVGAGGVNPQRVRAGIVGETVRRPPAGPGFIRRIIADIKIDLRPGAAADPIALQFLDAVGPIEVVEAFEQSVGVVGDPHHPLTQRNATDRMSATLAFSVDDFFVGEHGAQPLAPVDQRVIQVGQAVVVAVGRDRGFTGGGDVVGDRQFGDRPTAAGFAIEPGVVDHQEDPLGPAEVFLVGGRKHPRPVVGEPEHLQLPGEVVDVRLGLDPRVFAGLDGVFFGGQPESIESHRVQDVDAVHPLEPGDDVGRGVSLGVADV